jgi:hypothetical protein
MSLCAARIRPNFSWIVKRLRFAGTNGGASTSLFGLASTSCVRGGVLLESRFLDSSLSDCYDMRTENIFAALL